MKMTADHYDILKAKVALIVPLIDGHREALRNDPRVKDLEKRLLWDVFHATKIHDLYSYQEFDYNDTHIETAMRQVFKELDVKPAAASVPLDHAASLTEIEDKSGLSLAVIVDGAGSQLHQLFENHEKESEIWDWSRSDALFENMSKKLCAVYTASDHFRNKCQSDERRDHVQTFVQHWVATEFAQTWPELRNAVPQDFYVGRPMPETASSSPKP